MKEIDFLPAHCRGVRPFRRNSRRWLVLIGTGAVLALVVHPAGVLRPRGAAGTPDPGTTIQATWAPDDDAPQTQPSAAPPERRVPTG